MKICSKCKQQKQLSEFSKDNHAKDGLRYSCKKCSNEAQRVKSRKKFQFTCESCGEKKEIDYYSHKKRKTNFCLNCVAKKTQTGIRKPRGDASYISSDGYKMIKYHGEYDNAGRTKYKREHILVMEKHLGRKLKTQRGLMGEQVHHIDGDKLNNDINNLLFCKDTREHKNIDCQLHELAFELVRNHIISFDKQESRYKIEWEKINATIT